MARFAICLGADKDTCPEQIYTRLSHLLFFVGVEVLGIFDQLAIKELLEMLKRPHGMRLLFFCTAGLALALLPECVVGQISNITNTTVAPTLGSGHDYLGGVNDIVNPANGLPSVRIGLNTAAGRGLSVPLALSYNAGDVWILNSNTPDNVVIESAQKIASNQSGTSSPWTAGGWSITVPRLTQAAGSIDVPDPSNVTGYNPIKTCLVTTNFMFMDQAGGQHPLHMAYDSGNEGW